MAGTTSLLRSAASTRKKIQQQQDAEVAFEWDNSAQTYDQFQEYSKYLQDRQNSTSDPSQALSYSKTLRSARRSYTSNELQRQQMAIMEGRAGTQDKMDAVKSLYYQAVDNQDFNLAQNLISQWDNLSVKLQNEQDVAARAFATSSSKVKDTLLNDLQKGVNDVTLPTGQVVTPLAALTQNFQDTGDTVGILKAAQETIDAIRSVVIDQYNNATTQDEVNKLEQKYGKGLQNIDREITLDIGGKKLNLQDVVNASANDQMNNPKYSLEAVRNEATGKNEFKLKENNVSSLDYSLQYDAQGNAYYTPITVRTDLNKLQFGSSDQGRGLNTQITNTGEVIGGGTKTGAINAGTGTVKRDESQTIANRLKSLGIVAEQQGTTLNIKLPGENVQRQATIQPDGSIRYFDDSGNLIEFGLVDRNLGSNALPQIFKAGEQRIVSPTEISDFGTKSAFGGQLSQASQQGTRYLQDILGQTKQPLGPISGPIRTGNDFSGYGTAVTSNLLQTAGVTRAAIQKEQDRQLMLQTQSDAAARLQATPTFNLNQTPVQQFAASGVLKSQLQVAAPAAQPRLYVAPAAPQPTVSVTAPPPTPRISGVYNYPVTNKVTVGNF